MIIIIQDNYISPRFCWDKFLLNDTIELWKQTNNPIPRHDSIWLNDKLINDKNFQINHLGWGMKLRLYCKLDGGDPEKERRINSWKDFVKTKGKIDKMRKFDNGRRYFVMYGDKPKDIKQIKNELKIARIKER
jgi:hypothetical protein